MHFITLRFVDVELELYTRWVDLLQKFRVHFSDLAGDDYLFSVSRFESKVYGLRLRWVVCSFLDYTGALFWASIPNLICDIILCYVNTSILS